MSSFAQTSARFLCQFSAKIHKQRYPCCSPCQAWSDKRSWSTLQGCLWHFSANGYSVIGLIVPCAAKREAAPEAVLIHDVTPRSTNYKDKLGSAIFLALFLTVPHHIPRRSAAQVFWRYLWSVSSRIVLPSLYPSFPMGYSRNYVFKNFTDLPLNRIAVQTLL